MSALQDFREQYPQYNEIDDETLAQSLHQKYYSTMDYSEFRQSVGLEVATPPTLPEKIDQKIQDSDKELSPLQDDSKRLSEFSSQPDESERSFFDTAMRKSSDWLSNVTEGLGESITEGVKGGLKGLLVAGLDAGPDKVTELIPAAALPIGLQDFATDFSKDFAQNMGIESDSDLMEAKSGAVMKTLESIRQGEKKVQELTPDDLDVVQEGIRSGINSLARQAPGFAASLMTRSPAPMLGSIGVQTFGDSYATARSADKEPVEALRFASIDTAIEIITEKIPADSLMKIVGGKKLANKQAKEALRFAISEGLGEQAATAGQSLNAYLHGLDAELENAASATEVAEIQGRRQAVTFFATLVAGGAQYGAAKGVSKVMDKFDSPEKQLARAMDAEIEGAQFVTPPSEIARQLFDPSQPSQFEPEIINDYVAQGLPAVVGLTNEEAQEWQQAEAGGLDMTKEARIARALEMGYITDLDAVIEQGDSDGLADSGVFETGYDTGSGGQPTGVAATVPRDTGSTRDPDVIEHGPATFYHGTADDIEAFELNHPKRKDLGWLGTGIYLTNAPVMANQYAKTKGSRQGFGENVLPLHIRAKKLYRATLDDKGRLQKATAEEINAFTNNLKDQGYDGAALVFGDGTQEVVIFDPSNIRSANAAFAPGSEASTDLLGRAPESSNQNNKRKIVKLKPQAPEVMYSDTLDMQAGTNYAPLISKTGDLPVNAGREYQLGNGRTVRIPKQPVRRRHIIKKMQKKLGNRIYEGKVKGKTRLGFYRNRIGEIRIKNKNDLEVTAHEVAHWLDDRYTWVKPLYKQFDKEIRAVSYDEKLDYEGWAEFMRLWFTQEHEARTRAPGFYDAFSKALKDPKRKELAGTLHDVQEMMHAWFMQGVRARMASKVGDHDLPISERLAIVGEQATDKVLQKTLDSLHAFKVAEVEIQGEVADATLSPYKSFRLAAGYAGVAKAVLNHGTVGWTADGNIEFTGKSLNDIFAPVEDVMEDAQLYFVARRAQELSEQGRENLFRPDEINYGLGLGESNPAIKTAFNEWLAFNDRMLDFYEQSGIIGAEQREAIQTINKNYVPFNRVIETAGDISAGRKNKVARAASPLVRLKGGTGNINDVFDNIVNNTTSMIQMSLLNRSKSMFYDMVQQADNQTGAMYAVKIPPAAAPVNIDSEQVKKAMVQGLGLSMRDYRTMKEMPASPEDITMINTIETMFEGMQDFVTFFQHGLAPTGNVDFYFRNGKKVYYEVGDPLLYDAITHIGPQTHNLAVNILGGFANVLRRGTTATLPFQIKNFIRDTMNAFTLSKGQIVPVASAAKALFQRVYNEPEYWEYMANGGGFATVAEADGINTDKIADVNSVLAKYDEIMGSFEMSNRLAEYKALKKKGVSLREATFAGREISTDFAMRGTNQALRVLTISIPFMNARLQGHYRIAREVGRRQPGGKFRIDPYGTFNYALRGMIAITIPSLILYMINREDERYLEQLNYVKDLSWFVSTGPGEDDYILIPKPFETGIYFGSIPERMMAKLRDEEHGEEITNAMLWMMMESFGLDLIPQAFKPLDDLRRNKSFTGAPIISEYMQAVEPSEQYKAYTSDAMIALGRSMNISPIKAEYLVRGYFGTLCTWALGSADYFMQDLSEGGERVAKDWEDNILISPFVNDGPLKRTHSETLLYDMLKETRVAVNTVNLMERRDPKRLEQYVSEPETQVLMGANRALESSAKKLRELRGAQDRIRSASELSGEEKRKQIQAIQRAINEVARETKKAINPEDIQAMIDSIEAADNQRAVQ